MQRIGLILTGLCYLVFAVRTLLNPCDSSSMYIGLCGTGKIFVLILLAILFAAYLFINLKVKRKNPLILPAIFICGPILLWLIFGR